MLSTISSFTLQGQRKNMEDCIFPPQDTATLTDKLFIVCDGVGGRSKGEEASRIVCESISDYIFSGLSQKSGMDLITSAVDYSLNCMQEYTAKHKDALEMSTTLALAYLQRKEITIAWCGDSRIYHIRNGEIRWKSKDHSLLQQLIDLGELSPEETRNYPGKNIITRSLNPQRNASLAEIHVIHEYKAGDYLFLCSDGVLETIDDEIICSILNPKNRETDKTKLLLKYSLNKTQDNYSMYLLQLSKSAKDHALTALVATAIALPIIIWLIFRML